MSTPLPFDTHLRIAVGQCSEKGIKSRNEDAIGIRIPDGSLLTTKGIVAVLSDGVSAAECGAKASAISVSNFLADYYSTPESWSVETASTKVINALNRWLYGLGQNYRDARKGYVCTFSALVFKSCSVHVLHVGDSRIYRLRDGHLQRLTQDHASQVSDKQRYLTRAIGMDLNLAVDYQQLTSRVGDLYLISSDGVHDVLTDDEIGQALTRVCHQSPSDNQLAEASEQLVTHALDAGSQDNLSCQLLYVAGLPSQDKADVYRRLAEKPFPPPLDVGMVLDGYRVDKVLHQSQRSQVYLVTDTHSDNAGRQLCMKTPSVNYLDDGAYIERFMLESWIGSRINSTHVVKVLDNHRAKSALYYLTEYQRGLTLSQWLVQYPQTAVEEVLSMLKQLELGLRAFHRRETLHQDLKPDNIIVGQDGRVRIIDFGACLIKGVTEINSPLQRDSLLGTADYTAPEVILGMASSVRSELFSLAAIAYEMLSGHAVYQGKLSHCRHVKDYLRLEYIPAYQLNPMIPEWLDEPLKKALSIDPRHRQADTCEFIDALIRSENHQKIKPFQPLIARDPIKFWQSLCIIQLCLLIYLLIST
ncbi:bifunctional protein-serine/threonine kinase/phosphatase [Shewanella sp. CG12_big_fil_rev_8_21_14_0_65_47_15]|uniref:bifunctional protein-serine/threonine kinase/phosphatase n=1 Tax=Shewanella sp. CG12_big_fil_rev_8_21_14_0_65_47_15 TaxID=1975537 RepID=UPI0025F4ABF0|nr:bifunctional protein-serine/threonine kinase/phosphatase [Shewanella sp. CG12_big_fil_rev_8_21_14_0_65_47_15]